MLNETTLALVLFAGIAALVGAVALAAKDIWGDRRQRRAQKTAATTGIRLQRVPTAPAANDGIISKFDHWFYHLVRETGLGIQPLSGLMLLVFFGTLVGGVMFVCSDHPMIGTFGVALGMAATLGFLLYRRTQHIKLVQEQLPSALDMLAGSIRAGESIDQAMDLVGSRSPEPLAAEFRYCAKQLSMGLSMAAVMRSLVGRVRLTDMRIFTTTLTVHRRTGGNLARVLQRLATVVRQRLSYRRQLRSTTGAGRFSAILIACIGPLLFCYLLFVHPQYMESMLTSPMGQSLLTLAFALEVVGLIWTARLLKPTY